MTPPVTVLMSVYNGERWLEDSIKSVLEQTHGDFEFIIVNDGSKDASLDIIKSFAKKDRRIHIIHKQNTGLADSLNVGLNKARGKWIARIDADDLCNPSRLAIQYAMAQSKKEVVLIGSGHTQIDYFGQAGKLIFYPANHRKLVKRLRAVKPFFGHSSAFFRTELAKSLGGYRTRFKRAQDYDMWLRMSELGEIACVQDSLVRIRQHTDQISHDEGGMRQLVDARVALISHHIRQGGFHDPAAEESSNEEFETFFQFVKNGIEQHKLIEFRHFINEVKVVFGRVSFGDASKFLRLIAGSPQHLFRYVKQSLFGEEIAVKLLKEWVNRDTQYSINRLHSNYR